MNRPVHFEIHAEDPERAAAFYGRVFGWSVSKWDSPAMEYWVVMTGPEWKSPENATNPGINGGIVRRKGPAPAPDAPISAFVCTMTVRSIDETMAAVEAAGGSIALPKFALADMGWLGYCKDTEGNIFGVMEEKQPAS